MPLPTPEIGLVIGYSYLWKSEAEQGQTEGVKNRPCAIILTVQTEEKDQLVTLVPITHTPPLTPDDAIEIPHNTKRRLGLDGERSWVVITEVNRFFGRVPTCVRSVVTNRTHLFMALCLRLFSEPSVTN